jgi:hypothetical protein
LTSKKEQLENRIKELEEEINELKQQLKNIKKMNVELVERKKQQMMWNWKFRSFITLELLWMHLQKNSSCPKVLFLKSFISIK